MEADGKFFSGQMLQSESSKQKLASAAEKRKSSAEPPECDALYMERRTLFVCQDEANYKLFGAERIKLKQPGAPSLILLSNETWWLLECQTFLFHLLSQYKKMGKLPAKRVKKIGFTLNIFP